MIESYIWGYLMKHWLILLIFCSFLVSAHISQTVKDEIDARIKHQFNPSIVLAVFANNQIEYYIQGFQDIEKSIKAGENSVYEIGSISKTFTALLLAQMVTDNKLKLDDAVDQYWDQYKPNTEIKDKQGKSITFRQLSTHTSGLRRLPHNLNGSGSDPYKTYNRQQLLEAVATNNRKISTGNYLYSNYAAGLLGETLALIEGKSYQQLLEEKIFKPLNLNNTYSGYEKTPEQLRSTGYKDAKAVGHWGFDALAGAGSINASIKDLLEYGIAILNINNQQTNPLKESIKLVKQIHYQTDKQKIGLGWHFINKSDALLHDGGTGGFRSILIISPKQEKVIAAITNTESNAVTDIALHLLNEKYPMKKHDFPVEISTAQLQKYQGDFGLEESDKATKIVLENHKLVLRVPNQPDFSLLYIGNHQFINKFTQARLTFKFDQEEKLLGFTFKAWGGEQWYQKQN